MINYSQKTESFSVDYIEDSNNLTEVTRNLLLMNSSVFSESKPKSGLFKRKIDRSSPGYVKGSRVIVNAC